VAPANVEDTESKSGNFLHSCERKFPSMTEVRTFAVGNYKLDKLKSRLFGGDILWEKAKERCFTPVRTALPYTARPDN
jgi:hypothetical protein